MNGLVTAITVNFKTPELLYDCVTTFNRLYPDVTHIIVDNGGCRDSLNTTIDLFGMFEPVKVILNATNIGHGPAINKAIHQVMTPYVFLLDSDTRTERKGFLEKMLELFEDDASLFATGMLRYVNLNGVKANEGIPYIHPHACLMDVVKFRQVRPFTGRGAPALHSMKDAAANGWPVVAFPVEDYIWHKVAGTRGMFGGKFKPATDEKPREWKRFNL